jgi:hypothetical protein
MNTLNLGSDEIPATKKKSNTRNLKIALGLAAVILVPTIGSTLAGQITLTETSIEFGQGVLSTVTCQPALSEITITPTSALSAINPFFKIAGVRVSGINTACNGKIFSLKLVDSIGGPLILGAGTPPDTCIIAYDHTALVTAVSGGSSCTLLDDEVGEFVIAPSEEVDASTVYGITIESTDPVTP